MKVQLEQVTLSSIQTYISVGKKSYCEHYIHLWENEDPSPYIKKSFTLSVVKTELLDPNSMNFLVKAEGNTIGIVKLVKNAKLDGFTAEESLLAEKIYLLRDIQ